MDDVYIEEGKRNGMGIVSKKTIPSLHLTHKYYKKMKVAQFFCDEFPKETRKNFFFSKFSRVYFSDFSTIFLFFFLPKTSSKTYFFIPKNGGYTIT